MKVLVATKKTQGWRPGDHFRAVAGELVRFPWRVCASPDRLCRRAAVGIASMQLTTTFTVVSSPAIDRTVLSRRFRQGVLAEAHTDPPIPPPGDDEFEAYLDWHVDVAQAHDVGDVLELRDDIVRIRLSSAAPREVTRRRRAS